VQDLLEMANGGAYGKHSFDEDLKVKRTMKKEPSFSPLPSNSSDKKGYQDWVARKPGLFYQQAWFSCHL